MSIDQERIERFEAEVRRRIDAYLEHRRDTAPDGPGLDLEDYAALERGFARDVMHEPGWEDVRTLWRERSPGPGDHEQARDDAEEP
ncbi:MAG: hypothetical protein WB493_13125 [Anaeromyxobacteraceae bacterium]